MKANHYILLMVACLLAACGGNDTFSVEATVEGLGTQNVRAVYRSEGRLVIVPAMALDGKFRFVASSPKPVLVDIYTGARKRIGSLVASNGDNLRVTYAINAPGSMTAKGNKATEALARFAHDNADALNLGDAEAINEAVEAYVKSNPDNPVSAYLILSHYNASVGTLPADSLMMMVSPEARPSNDILASFREPIVSARDTMTRWEPIRLYAIKGDSVTTIDAGSKSRGLLFVVTEDQTPSHRTSNIERLNALNDSVKNIRIVELAVTPDTAELKSDVTPNYTVCWEPGGIATPAMSRLPIRRVPWVIATDTTGVITYSGPQLDEAVAKLK